jgi:hypothetical protein
MASRKRKVRKRAKNPPMTRKFDGKLFHFADKFSSRVQANNYADNYKKRGYYVRVVSDYGGYTIYIREPGFFPKYSKVGATKKITKKGREITLKKVEPTDKNKNLNTRIIKNESAN